MELNNLEDTKALHHSLKMEEQQREEGEVVSLLLSLPGGRVEEKKLKIGVTVAYVSCEGQVHVKAITMQNNRLAMQRQQAKLIIQKEFDLEGVLTLRIDGRALIDPLSLCDCPGVKAGSSVKVTVEVA